MCNQLRETKNKRLNKVPIYESQDYNNRFAEFTANYMIPTIRVIVLQNPPLTI